jgi:hypothetical protein
VTNRASYTTPWDTIDADRDHLGPEDFLVGRRISLDQVRITSPEEIPAEQREVIQKAAEGWENSPDYQKPLTAEERRQTAVDGVLSAPLSAAYISRLLSQLSAAVAKADPANALRSGEGTEA